MPAAGALSFAGSAGGAAGSTGAAGAGAGGGGGGAGSSFLPQPTTVKVRANSAIADNETNLFRISLFTSFPVTHPRFTCVSRFLLHKCGGDSSNLPTYHDRSIAPIHNEKPDCAGNFLRATAASHCLAVDEQHMGDPGAISFTLTLTTPDATKDHVIFFWRQSLADHPSVEKRYRQSVKRRTRNIEIKSRLRTLMKKARQAIESNNQDIASSQIQGVNKALGKAVSKGIIKKNTASRWLSRLARSAHRSKS